MTAIEIPGYKIIKTLGVGGQATVYLAIQEGFEREVALKVMSPALAADPSFGERFIREAKIVAQLSHDRIVTVYDVGKSGNYYYLAMEYMRGEELKSKISQGLKAKDALLIVSKLARALHFAHQKGYIHRDVKSENILFNDDDQPVLTDFGIAKASNSSTQMTQTGKLIGTPEYMSPEQCRGKELDGRSDLYSLGIILYEMLTRKVPFTGKDSVSICIKHVTKPVPKLPARVSHFQWLVDSLLAKNPDKRFQSGLELNEAILSYLEDGHPVRFESPSEAKTQISGTTDVPILEDEYTEPSLTEVGDDQGLSDNFYIDKPFVAPEQKSRVAAISWTIIILFIGVVAYINKDSWLKHIEQNLPANLVELGKEYGIFDNRATSSKGLSGNSKDLRASKADKDKQTNLNGKQSSKDLLKRLNAIKSKLNSNVLTIDDFRQVAINLKGIVNNQQYKALSTEIKTQVNQIAIQKAVTATQKRDYQVADEWLKTAQTIDPDNQDIATSRQALVIQQKAYQQQLQQQQEQRRKEQLKSKISNLVFNAEKAIKQDRLATPEKENAIFYLREAEKLDANDARIAPLFETIRNRYLKLIDNALKSESLTKASDYFKILKSIESKKGQYLALENRIIRAKQRQKIKIREQKRREKIAREKRIAAQKRKEKLSNPLIKMQIESNIESANNLMLLGFLVEPIGNNAFEKYKAVLAIDELDTAAKTGIKKIESKLLEQVDNYLSQQNKNKAQIWINKLKLFNADHPKLPEFNDRLKQLDS